MPNTEIVLAVWLPLNVWSWWKYHILAENLLCPVFLLSSDTLAAYGMYGSVGDVTRGQGCEMWEDPEEGQNEVPVRMTKEVYINKSV